MTQIPFYIYIYIYKIQVRLTQEYQNQRQKPYEAGGSSSNTINDIGVFDAALGSRRGHTRGIGYRPPKSVFPSTSTALNDLSSQFTKVKHP